MNLSDSSKFVIIHYFSTTRSYFSTLVGTLQTKMGYKKFSLVLRRTKYVFFNVITRHALIFTISYIILYYIIL